MDAALVRECARADVGGVGIRRDIRHLGHEVGQLGQAGQVVAGGDGGPADLEREVCPDRHEVGVAASLAVAIDRALHVIGAGLDGGEGVCHRQARVIVNVDPDDRPRTDLAHHAPRHRSNLIGEAAAVRVTQHHRRRAGVDGRSQGGKGIGRICLAAVEEVLGVVDDLPPGRSQMRDRIADHRQVLLRRGAEHLGHVEEPALAEDRGDRRLRRHQRPDVRILLGPIGTMARRAERGQPGMPERHSAGGREELLVLRIGAGPAALDVRESSLVEPSGDLQLVRQ